MKKNICWDYYLDHWSKISDAIENSCDTFTIWLHS